MKRAYAEVPDGRDRSMGNLHLHLSSGREIDKHRVECWKPSTKLGSPSLADCVRFESSQGTQVVIFVSSVSYIRYHFISVIQLALSK